MNTTDITHLVDRGLQLHRSIEAAKAEMKEINKRISDYAAAHPEEHIPLEDPEREGTRYIARGSGFAIPVVFTADFILQKLRNGSDKLEYLKSIAGPAFRRFYRPADYHVVATEFTAGGMFNGVKFRAAAREHIPDHAEEFISAARMVDKNGIPISRTAVCWADATSANFATPIAE